jgi:hypothetical protein
VNPESLVKAYVLSYGVDFTFDAMQHALAINAKRQNVVYNLPATGGLTSATTKSSRLTVATSAGELARPQELFLAGDDGYTVCVSASLRLRRCSGVLRQSSTIKTAKLQ